MKLISLGRSCRYWLTGNKPYYTMRISKNGITVREEEKYCDVVEVNSEDVATALRDYLRTIDRACTFHHMHGPVEEKINPLTQKRVWDLVNYSYLFKMSNPCPIEDILEFNRVWGIKVVYKYGEHAIVK